MLTGAATYIRRDPVSGRKLRRGPIAHKIAPAVLRDFWFSILPNRSAMRIPAMKSAKNGW
jgi:hypothetical protein